MRTETLCDRVLAKNSKKDHRYAIRTNRFNDPGQREDGIFRTAPKINKVFKHGGDPN